MQARSWLSVVVLAMGAVGGAFLADVTVLRPSVEPWLIDNLHVSRPDTAADSELVIASVDDATLERLPDPFVFWGPQALAAGLRLSV